MLEGGSAPAIVLPRPNMFNYSYLDGLRGIGALVVYLNHFLDHFYHLPTKKKLDEGKEEQLPNWTRQTPVVLFYHGYFWVVVFFVLSGFVLTLRFFKVRKSSCVTGGTFRRYLRLMIPVWVVFSLTYFAIKM